MAEVGLKTNNFSSLSAELIPQFLAMDVILFIWTQLVVGLDFSIYPRHYTLFLHHLNPGEDDSRMKKKSYILCFIYLSL